jgi:hypothetical protein
MVVAIQTCNHCSTYGPASSTLAWELGLYSQTMFFSFELCVWFFCFFPFLSNSFLLTPPYYTIRPSAWCQLIPSLPSTPSFLIPASSFALLRSRTCPFQLIQFVTRGWPRTPKPNTSFFLLNQERLLRQFAVQPKYQPFDWQFAQTRSLTLSFCRFNQEKAASKSVYQGPELLIKEFGIGNRLEREKETVNRN